MSLKPFAVFGDPKEILLAISGKHHLPELLPLAARCLARTDRIALARIWLTRPPEPGDCGRCLLQSECKNREQCLHLAASFGHSALDPNEHWDRLDGDFRRMPLGVRKVGYVAASGEPVRINLAEHSDWIVRPEWARDEGVVVFQGMPLRYRHETLGVLGLFSREPLGESCDQWLAMISDHLAAAIANARSIDEIESLKKRLEMENEYLREEVGEVSYGELVGSSAALQAIVRQIDLVAPTNSSVLILGESGTGKELVAREVHRRSRRADHPLIRVNCAAIPRELYESEFFGHSKGSFTGALRDRVGRFELADGGTLFLDEIGEIPLDLQSKLLRILQEGELERIGEERTRQVDVRIIAATNRNLRQEAQQGRFREDLYYRLSVFPIELAPLRSRAEDIPLLSEHFLTGFARRLGRRKPKLTLANIQQLQRYHWPGNVRELQHVLERAAIVALDGRLRFDLPDESKSIRRTASVPVSSAASSPTKILTEQELRDLQAENIARALDRAGGKVYGPEGAAALLGIKPTTLASRMRSFGIKS